jgi:hypothetical protein
MDVNAVNTEWIIYKKSLRSLRSFAANYERLLEPEELAVLKSQGIIAGDVRAALRSQIVILNTHPLRSQNVTLKRGRHAKCPPYGFIEHGAIMAANVLNSPEAVAMSVYVVRAFIQMRERLAANAAILKRLAEIDKTLLEHDQTLRIVWQKLQPLLQPSPEPHRRRIGFQTENKT